MNNELLGKVIIVVGGTKGVGAAAAIEFARQGAKVVIGGRDRIAADKIIDTISLNYGQATYVNVDLRDISSCKILFAETEHKYGKVDGLFYYAGITPISPLDSCDEEIFDNVMDINFKACFFCCQEAIKYMRKVGGGSIVLTGSAHAWNGQKDRAAYACSKGVLLTLMNHIAHNYATEHVRCNYLVLGWTPTEGEIAFRKTQGETEEELRKRAAHILPMGRMCESYDYLDSLVIMMSDVSKMMTGSVFRITGGEYI